MNPIQSLYTIIPGLLWDSILSNENILLPILGHLFSIFWWSYSFYSTNKCNFNFKLCSNNSRRVHSLCSLIFYQAKPQNIYIRNESKDENFLK